MATGSREKVNEIVHRLRAHGVLATMGRAMSLNGSPGPYWQVQLLQGDLRQLNELLDKVEGDNGEERWSVDLFTTGLLFRKRWERVDITFTSRQEAETWVARVHKPGTLARVQKLEAA